MTFSSIEPARANLSTPSIYQLGYVDVCGRNCDTTHDLKYESKSLKYLLQNRTRSKAKKQSEEDNRRTMSCEDCGCAISYESFCLRCYPPYTKRGYPFLVSSGAGRTVKNCLQLAVDAAPTTKPLYYTALFEPGTVPLLFDSL